MNAHSSASHLSSRRGLLTCTYIAIYNHCLPSVERSSVQSVNSVNYRLSRMLQQIGYFSVITLISKNTILPR